MKVLIIGLGSIAKKHISALQEIDPTIELTALRSSSTSKPFDGIKNIFHLENEDLRVFDVFLISSPTFLHFQHLQTVIPLNKPIFLEKPPIAQLEQHTDLLKLHKPSKSLIYCGYNMRFHPAIIWLRELASSERILEISAYCGSYLPDWRPSDDYTQSYSAKTKLGGGVHLDVIHELDYLTWIFGNPLRYTVNLSRVSSLQIDSVDSANYLLKYKNMVINITLNYFRKTPKRVIEIVTETNVYTLDLIESQVFQNGHFHKKFDSGIQETYLTQMKFFLSLVKGEAKPMTSFEEALGLLKIALDG